MEGGATGRTRRDLLKDGAYLAAGGMAGGLLLDAAPAGATIGAAVSSTGAPTFPATPPLASADYWTFVDWIFEHFNEAWDASIGSYGYDSRLNCGLLVTHSIAALTGHTGPSRQDARAVTLAKRLCKTPPFRPGPKGRSTGSNNPRSPSQRHTPGWVASMRKLASQQQISIDPKVAEGLIYAWRARDIIKLPKSTAARIEDRIVGTAKGRFFAYPGIRLNQINWSAELYQYAAEVSGNRKFLTHDYHRQLARFLRGSTRRVSPWAIPNLGPSYSFHRHPFQAVDQRQNIESSEYANVCLEAIQRYSVAKKAGMASLSPGEMRTLRAWVKRALAAYWAHSGYLNWDTGLYLQRWHLGRYWAFGIQGLFAIALASDLRSQQEGEWAKWFFDKALYTYIRLAREVGPSSVVPKSPLFDIPTAYSVNQALFSGRFMSHAARAVYYGFGTMPTSEPPPLYAFDPSIGRLAVTTPAYNTAIVNVSNGAFPYGGIGPARFYDSDQRVLGSVGGRAPAGFGVVVRNSAGRTVCASQRVRRRPGGSPPLVLKRSPQGKITRGSRYPKNPYTGPFTELVATGAVDQGGVTIRATTTFKAESLTIAYGLSRRSSSKYSADALFPTWGKTAKISAVLKNGSTLLLAAPGVRRKVALSRVRFFFLQSQEAGAGYVVVVQGGASGRTAGITTPPKQTSNPSPGPSLTVGIAAASSWKKLSLAAAIAPAADAATAATVAAAL